MSTRESVSSVVSYDQRHKYDPTSSLSLAVLEKIFKMFMDTCGMTAELVRSHCVTCTECGYVIVALALCRQNVDGLEVLAGLPDSACVNLYGKLDRYQCKTCKNGMPREDWLTELLHKVEVRCPTAGCKG